MLKRQLAGLAVATAATLTAATCSSRHSIDNARPTESDAENAIQVAVVSALASSGSSVVVVDRTAPNETVIIPRVERARDVAISWIPSELKGPFVSQNAQPDARPVAFPGNFGRRISIDELNKLAGASPTDFWASFHRLYGSDSGFCLLSRAGVSADGQTALLYTEEHRGLKSLLGTWWILKRQGSEWIVAERRGDWLG